MGKQRIEEKERKCVLSLGKVIASIKRNKSFLIACHTNPEGDALGAQLGFYCLLKKLGKQATLVNEESLPYGLDFLPQSDKINTYSNTMKLPKFDCFVVVDCSDLKRTGEVYKLKPSNLPVINIDHHVSNERFGTVNWVDLHASSASEMVYKIYKRMGIPFDKESAMLLYVGMVTDTGSFRYSNTTAKTHRAVADLLGYGIDVVAIHRQLYENIPLEDMRLLSRILPGLKISGKGKIAWFEIKRNLLRRSPLSFDLSEHVLSFARAIKGVEVCVLFKENLGVKNEIRVNFRSNGKVDVNKIAGYFSGGGHKTASGATVKGEIQSVRNKVLAKIRENL